MKPGYIERARQSLKEERRQLAEERARLVREEKRLTGLQEERRAWAAERGRALVALRLLCARFGDLDWDATVPLDEVLTEHLADPLEEMVARVNRRLGRLSDGLTPRPAPPIASRPVAVAAHPARVERTAGGFVSVCGCGWISSPSWTEGEALVLGRAHADVARADDAERRHG